MLKMLGRNEFGAQEFEISSLAGLQDEERLHLLAAAEELAAVLSHDPSDDFAKQGQNLLPGYRMPRVLAMGPRPEAAGSPLALREVREEGEMRRALEASFQIAYPRMPFFSQDGIRTFNAQIDAVIGKCLTGVLGDSGKPEASLLLYDARLFNQAVTLVGWVWIDAHTPLRRRYQVHGAIADFLNAHAQPLYAGSIQTENTKSLKLASRLGCKPVCGIYSRSS